MTITAIAKFKSLDFQAYPENMRMYSWADFFKSILTIASTHSWSNYEIPERRWAYSTTILTAAYFIMWQMALLLWFDHFSVMSKGRFSKLFSHSNRDFWSHTKGELEQLNQNKSITKSRVCSHVTPSSNVNLRCIHAESVCSNLIKLRVATPPA